MDQEASEPVEARWTLKNLWGIRSLGEKEGHFACCRLGCSHLVGC